MSKNVILYRIKNGECRYIEISNNEIHLDYQGKPIVTNACCSTRMTESFNEVETWLTEDVYNRMLNTDGIDTFSDVADMIKCGEHKDFEDYIRTSEIETISEMYNVYISDAEDLVDAYDNDFFDASIVLRVYDNAEEIARDYVDCYVNLEGWIERYIDYNAMGEDMVMQDDYRFYELSDGRVVEYSL